MPSSLPCTIAVDCLGFVGWGSNDVKKHRSKIEIKILNPETENSQIPAPLYVNKMGKVETVVANLCRRILRITLQNVYSVSFRRCF